MWASSLSITHGRAQLDMPLIGNLSLNLCLCVCGASGTEVHWDFLWGRVSSTVSDVGITSRLNAETLAFDQAFGATRDDELSAWAFGASEGTPQGVPVDQGSCFVKALYNGNTRHHVL